MPKLDIPAVRKAVTEKRYIITIHAKQRMGQRKILLEEVKQVIATGEVIEQYPKARPLPKVLFMAYIKGEPL